MVEDLLNDSLEFYDSLRPFYGLKNYFWAIYEFLPHSASQRRVRIEAKLKKENDPVAIGEYLSEIESIKSEGGITLPHFLWGGYLVSIYAAYECSTVLMFDYLHKNNKVNCSFKEWSEKISGRKDFITLSTEFSRQHVGIELIQEKFKDIFINLKDLRNSYVHNGCFLHKLPKRTSAGILNKSQPWLALEISNDSWLANTRSSWIFLHAVKDSIDEYSKLASNKHIWKFT